MIGRDQMLNGSDLGETVQSRGTEGSAPALGPACTDLGGFKAAWIGLSRSSGSRSLEDSPGDSNVQPGPRPTRCKGLRQQNTGA